MGLPVWPYMPPPVLYTKGMGSRFTQAPTKRALLLWLLVAVLIIGVPIIFILPWASCPNCTGAPGDHWNVATKVDGKFVPVNCDICNGHSITFWRRWTSNPETDAEHEH